MTETTKGFNDADFMVLAFVTGEVYTGLCAPVLDLQSKLVIQNNQPQRGKAMLPIQPQSSFPDLRAVSSA